MDNPKIVLYVGNDARETTRVCKTLDGEQQFDFQVLAVSSRQAFVESLQQHTYACVISEYHAPELNPEQLMQAVSAQNSLVPVLFLIEPDEEFRALDVLAWGASGYVLKTPHYLKRLPGAVLKACEQQQLQTSHHRMVRELRQLIDSANAPIFGVDTRGCITEWNLAAAKITGYTKGDLLGKHLVDNFIAEGHREAVKHVFDLALDEIETVNFELPLHTKSGATVSILLNTSVRRNDDDEITGVIGVGQDITERRRAEEALSWESGVNAALADLSRAIISASSMVEISDLIAEHARCFTRSQWTSVASLTENPDADDMSSDNDRFEHVLTVPVMVEDTPLGQISVANANTGYTGRDRALLERLADVYALALERHQREQELRQLSIAVDQSAAVIVITDRDGRIVFVNTAFERATGYAREEIIGQNPRVLKSTFLPPAVYQQLWATISNGGVWQGEFLNQRKDGSAYWEEAIITPITNADGEITHYIAVKEDITQRKSAEDALKKAKEEAEAANRLKNEFLANISHEIRTPMNAILGFADLLGEHETDPAKQHQLHIIRESGQQLLKIINDVLDFAKLESGTIEVQHSMFAFREMLHSLYQRYAPQAEQVPLGFTLDIADDVPTRVYGDEVRILQLLGNVVHNAIKFTRKGFVSFQCTYQHNIAIFRITDSGIGIPEDKVERMLVPFEQVDASATRHHGGAGLGLAITQKLVRIMSGTLSLKSTFGHGTIVTIELPVPAKKRAQD